MTEFYYVIQTNHLTGEEKILGFNLVLDVKNSLFYSLGREKNSACGMSVSGDEHLRNSYGIHHKKYKTIEEAQNELITKPTEFNACLILLSSYGYDVVKRGIVHHNVTVKSYQSEFLRNTK